MRIKICGITNLEDALAAIKAGAHALGFVFYEPSTRYITPDNAQKIIEQLPPFVQIVGLFVNMEANAVNQISQQCKIDLAQIHFEATDDFYEQLNVKYIKVIRAQSKQDIVNIQNEYVLVDAFVQSYGGEGKRVALEWFEKIACEKIILAGGLDALNLSQLNNFGFYGVDVSSGVEAQKGKKDKTMMIDFVQRAHEII
ncbi:MAG: phosphoribosylanthranilate isomerase [Campylobacterota bacterium]|nr:phosphoribosylanthranilate isomerase [Campylobacterota bacterium]